jgi:hypothetical protein
VLRARRCAARALQQRLRRLITRAAAGHAPAAVGAGGAASLLAQMDAIAEARVGCSLGATVRCGRIEWGTRKGGGVEGMGRAWMGSDAKRLPIDARIGGSGESREASKGARLLLAKLPAIPGGLCRPSLPHSREQPRPHPAHPQ